MKVLVVGSGGREAAAVKRLSEDGGAEVFVAPGNPGMKPWAKLARIEAGDTDGLLKFAISEGVDLTFVGPEAPLIAGINDEFHSAGLKIVGPNKHAAFNTEGSKVKTQLLQMYGVKIAPGACFDDPESACDCIEKNPELLVVKADEPDGGKGVIVASDQEHAKSAVRALMVDRIHGPKVGNRIVLQEKLGSGLIPGEEISFHVALGKDGYKIFYAVRDYKKDRHGNNTGGLGAKTITVPAWVVEKFIKDILEPTLEAFKLMGITYEGILYAGCMLVGDELFLLEYNCRFGDPELQVLLAKLKTRFLDVLMAIATGKVADLNLEYHDGEVVLVVGCSPGYPGKIPDSAKGIPIQLPGSTSELDPDTYILPAGVAEVDGVLVNSSGRATNYLARRLDHANASAGAYLLSDLYGFEGMWTLPGIGKTI